MSFNYEDYSILNNYSYNEKPFVISTLDCLSASLRWVLGGRDVYPLTNSDPMSLDRKIATVFFLTLIVCAAVYTPYVLIIPGVILGSLALKYIFSKISSEESKAIGTIRAALGRQANAERETELRRENERKLERLRQQELDIEIQQVTDNFTSAFEEKDWRKAVGFVEVMPKNGIGRITKENLYTCVKEIIASGNYSMEEVNRWFNHFEPKDRISIFDQIQEQKVELFYESIKNEKWDKAIDIYKEMPRKEFYSDSLTMCVNKIIESGRFNWDIIATSITLLNKDDPTLLIDQAVRSKLAWEIENHRLDTTGNDLCNFVCNLLGDDKTKIKAVFSCISQILVNSLQPEDQDNILVQMIKFNLVDETKKSYGIRMAKHSTLDLISLNPINLKSTFISKALKARQKIVALDKMDEKSAAIELLRKATAEEKQRAYKDAELANRVAEMNRKFIEKMDKLEKAEKRDFIEELRKLSLEIFPLYTESIGEEKIYFKAIHDLIAERLKCDETPGDGFEIIHEKSQEILKAFSKPSCSATSGFESFNQFFCSIVREKYKSDFISFSNLMYNTRHFV